jgi:glycogen(starch) synthase
MYEPFGMVALEAAAAGAPLAVAATGGLTEIIEPGVTGVMFPHSDPGALAEAVGTLLTDRRFAHQLAGRARNMVSQRYGWPAVAARTAESYAAACRAASRYELERNAELLARGRAQVVVPEGNLLARGAAA